MLSVGDRAPKFELTAINGERYALDESLTLAIFFKTNCPTCQYAWPFYERLAGMYTQAGLRVWGISQYNQDKTRQFAGQYNSNIPLLLDHDLQVSAEYDPDFVPTGFLIDSDQQIVAIFVSWNREQLNQLSQQVAEQLGVPFQPVVKPDETVVAFKPG
jgi:peroxiredoxin